MRIAIATALGLLITSCPAYAEFGQKQVGTVLSQQAKQLGYKLQFQTSNCAMGQQYVCDVTGKSGNGTFKFMAVSKSKDTPVTHFSLPLAPKNSAIAMFSYAVVASVIGDVKSSVEDMTPFLTDAIQQATDTGSPVCDPFRGIQQCVVVVPIAGMLVTVSYQEN